MKDALPPAFLNNINRSIDSTGRPIDIPVVDFDRGRQVFTVGRHTHFHAFQYLAFFSSPEDSRWLSFKCLKNFKRSWYPKVRNGHQCFRIKRNLTDTGTTTNHDDIHGSWNILRGHSTTSCDKGETKAPVWHCVLSLKLQQAKLHLLTHDSPISGTRAGREGPHRTLPSSIKLPSFRHAVSLPPPRPPPSPPHSVFLSGVVQQSSSSRWACCCDSWAGVQSWELRVRRRRRRKL